MASFAISGHRFFFTFKYGLIINLVWSLGMVCGMVRNFRTIPHTNPSYHTIFYSMPFVMQQHGFITCTSPLSSSLHVSLT